MQQDNIVYIVDPDKAIGEAVTALLATYGIPVQTFPSAEGFLDACPAEGRGRACLLVESDLPGLSGLALLQRLRAQGFSLPVIVLTNTASREVRRQAQQLGATDVIEKSLANEFLVTRLSELLPGTSHLPGAAAGGVALHDGKTVTFRVMHPEDAAIEQAFVRELSARSKHMRFFSSIEELSPSMLEQFTHPTYPKSYALIATVSEAEREQEIAVARYEPTGADGVAEFAVVVADEWQRFGIASQLLHGLTAIAAVAGIKRLEALVLRENFRMLKFVRELGFTTSPSEDDPTVVLVSKELRDLGRQADSPAIPGGNRGEPPKASSY